MINLLLYSSISCADADSIMIRIKARNDLPQIVQVELIEAIKESTPDCYPWDAHD